jgi:hypothetical protein
MTSHVTTHNPSRTSFLKVLYGGADGESIRCNHESDVIYKYVLAVTLNPESRPSLPLILLPILLLKMTDAPQPNGLSTSGFPAPKFGQ